MTSQHNIKQALINIAAKVRAGKLTSVADEILATFDSLEDYIEQAYLTAKATDSAKITKKLRGGGQTVTTQLSLFGMDHAALPSFVIIRDREAGTDQVVPMKLARFNQIKHQVRRSRQDVNFRESIVAAQEKTIGWLEEHGVTDEWTGAEIVTQFSDPEN